MNKKQAKKPTFISFDSHAISDVCDEEDESEVDEEEDKDTEEEEEHALTDCEPRDDEEEERVQEDDDVVSDVELEVVLLKSDEIDETEIGKRESMRINDFMCKSPAFKAIG